MDARPLLFPRLPCPRLARPARGFTLVELLVVLAIVALLLTLAVPRYFHSIDIARETVLVDNLATARATIDKFYGDTGRYPESLEELVEKKYLRTLPFDPVARSSSGWTIVPPEDASKGRVYDLRSSAPGSGAGNVPFSQR
ncbi:type II secretion system protein [Cupriavidus sp. 2TAF22]|uniref:type II secretion system protein n=1 Tax=unclassified Cupriavidus TaxID=2640874 RepID=UPI003F9114A9